MPVPPRVYRWAARAPQRTTFHIVWCLKFAAHQRAPSRSIPGIVALEQLDNNTRLLEYGDFGPTSRARQDARGAQVGGAASPPRPQRMAQADDEPCPVRPTGPRAVRAANAEVSRCLALNMAPSSKRLCSIFAVADTHSSSVRYRIISGVGVPLRTSFFE